MNSDQVKRLSENPEFISGIHNYCDRWCERCRFTRRCVNYAIGEEDRRNSGARSQDSEQFWGHLNSIFETTLELIRESSEQLGIDLDDLDPAEMAEIERERDRVREEAGRDPIAVAAEAYGEQVDAWMEQAAALFREKESELNDQVRLELPGAKPHLAAVKLSEALDVILWYQHFIHVKLMRALAQSQSERDWEDLEGFAKDSDGSAKIALIAIDRSMGAWGLLRESLPSAGDALLTILARLERLRKAVEKRFPAARAFRRPGFDYMPEE